VRADESKSFRALLHHGFDFVQADRGFKSPMIVKKSKFSENIRALATVLPAVAACIGAFSCSKGSGTKSTTVGKEKKSSSAPQKEIVTVRSGERDIEKVRPVGAGLPDSRTSGTDKGAGVPGATGEMTGSGTDALSTGTPIPTSTAIPTSSPAQGATATPTAVPTASDNTPPVVTIASPTAFSTVAGSFSIQGTCETGLQVSIASPLASAAPFFCSGGAYSFVVSLSGANGATTVTVSQTDSAGNIGTASIALEKNDSALNVSFLTPAASTFYTASSTGAVVSGTCVSGFPVALSGDVVAQNAVCVSGAFSFSNLTLVGPQGTKSLLVTQTNGAGGSASASRSVYLDSNAPIFTVAPAITSSLIHVPGWKPSPLGEAL
jgi:hypothetical protein